MVVSWHLDTLDSAILPTTGSIVDRFLGCSQECDEALSDAPPVLELALPNLDDSPAQALEIRHLRCVSGPVRCHFRRPELLVRFRQFAFTAVMTMPKATVDQNDFSSAGQNDIGRSWEVSAVQSEAIP